MFITDGEKHLNFVDDGQNEYWLIKTCNVKHALLFFLINFDYCCTRVVFKYLNLF